jgi:murein DD-endopeptidase MepM/ murein hydrolase activator NlpD
VERNSIDTAGSVAIDHHPRGLGLFTNYVHITGIQVSEGEFVQQGQPFAQVRGTGITSFAFRALDRPGSREPATG